MLGSLVAKLREWKEKIIIIDNNKSVPFRKIYFNLTGQKVGPHLHMYILIFKIENLQNFVVGFVFFFLSA